MDDDWKSQFMPGDEFLSEASDGMPELGVPEEEAVEVGEPVIGHSEGFLPDFSLTEADIAQLGNNQQRIMEAIDNMAQAFSQQLVILARRIDNFERVLDQSLGQPTMTNLMYDAPEVYEKVVNRELIDVNEVRAEDNLRSDAEIFHDSDRATEAKVPDPDFEVPSEVDHLLNFEADFPVSIEVQVAFHMWKEKHATFQAFVKAAGGPVLAKQAREHLE